MKVCADSTGRACGCVSTLRGIFDLLVVTGVVDNVFKFDVDCFSGLLHGSVEGKGSGCWFYRNFTFHLFCQPLVSLKNLIQECHFLILW